MQRVVHVERMPLELDGLCCWTGRLCARTKRRRQSEANLARRPRAACQAPRAACRGRAPARVVAESAALGEPWDVLNLHNKRWEGARSWWMTDRAFRLGCVHRAIHAAGMAYAVGLLYSKRGAEAVARAAQAEWEQPYDLFLGELSQRRLLRIFWWGCASRPLRHETFASCTRINATRWTRLKVEL